MLSTVEIPHLRAGQKIKDYKRLFKSATVSYKESEKLGCLPIYIHRTAGESELAYQATEKDSIDLAFKFLEDIIDGPPCEYLEAADFFAKKPEGESMDAIRSYFFELYEVSKRANITTDVFLKRFLSELPLGKQIYDANKDKIKVGLSNDEVTAVFQVVMEKLQKKMKREKVEIKEEPFVFNVNQSAVKEQVPQWARDMQEQLSQLQLQVSSELLHEDQESDEDTNAYPMRYSKPAQGTSKRCFVCNKPGHLARECYSRRCEGCGKKGHSKGECQTSGNKSNNKNGSKGGYNGRKQSG